MYPTNTVITLAKISQYLADNAIALGIEPDKQFANKLYIERKSVEWAYGQDPTDPTLIKTTNYLYTMCGAYVFEALGIIGQGGGVVPSPSGGGGTGVIPYQINIVVSAGQSGVMTISNTDWVGLVDLQPTCTINNTQFTLGTNYTYSTLTGTFDFSLAGYTLQQNDTFATGGFKNA